MKQTIKLMRLKTGEDIITQVVDKTDKTVEIINPMVIFLKRLETGRVMILLSPWIPVEIVADNSSELDISNIISVMNPRQSMIDHYIDTIERMAEIIIDENELQMSTFDDDDEEDEDDFYLENESETKGNKKLH